MWLIDSARNVIRGGLALFPTERTRSPVWRKGRVWAGYGAALVGIAAATGLLKLFGPHVNPTTTALAFLLVVLVVATAWGSRPAVFASLLGVAGFI